MDIVIADKWLFICSANYVRSPTAEYVARKALMLARSCGTQVHPSNDFVVTPITREIAEWADVIVCMEREHVAVLRQYLKPEEMEHVYCWNLPDDWGRPYDPQLVRIVEQKLADTMELRMIGMIEGKVRESEKAGRQD